MKPWIAILLLSACASLRVTPVAAARAGEEQRLENCLSTVVFYGDRNVCLQKSIESCRSHGLEADCGTGGLWTSVR